MFGGKSGLILDVVIEGGNPADSDRFLPMLERHIAAYGLGRCTWRGLDHFRACVWSAVVAYNLTLLGRLKPG